jgi:Protein of unknown function (DUF2523)
MPLFIAALIGGLVQAAGTLVGKVLMSLGFGYVIYSGIDTSIQWAVNAALGNLDGLPGIARDVTNALRVPQIISVFGTALTLRMTFNSMSGGSIRKLVQK